MTAAVVRIYKSTDASAPVLSGQVGALIGVLDACLVNGYGSQPAAGWTKPYTTTNVACFKNDSAGAQGYLRVDDTNAQYAVLKGYVTMTAHSTGENEFPNEALQAVGAYQPKSSTASSTARPWLLIACGRTFYFWAMTDKTTYGADSTAADIGFGFGAFISYKLPSDPYGLFLMAAITSSLSNTSRLGTVTAPPSTISTSFTAGIWVARAYTQIGGAIGVMKVLCTTININAGMGSVGPPYPDAVSGYMKTSRVIILENDGASRPVERGYLPGMYAPLHNKPASFWSTIVGTLDLIGKQLLLPPVYDGSSECRAGFEFDGDWGFR